VALRLFIAAWPPAPIIEELAALPRPDEPGVRWTTRDRWHVTLRFLGPVELADAQEGLARIAAAPAEARVGPRVARLGRQVIVAPISGLDELADATVLATAGLGQPPDPRPFAGHITLARLGHRGACRLTGHALSGAWPVTEITLVTSDLGRSGARYRTVARRRLSG